MKNAGVISAISELTDRIWQATKVRYSVSVDDSRLNSSLGIVTGAQYLLDGQRALSRTGKSEDAHDL